MGQVFISYDREDNKPGIYESSKERPIENHVNQIRKAYYDVIGEELNCFFDEKDINIGDGLEQRINNGIDNSNVFIAFITPGYLKSSFCLNEWDRFNNKKTSNKKIYPFIAKTIDDETFKESLQGRSKVFYEQLHEKVFQDLTDIDSKLELRDQLSQKLKLACKEIAKIIKSDGEISNTNTHTIDFPIDNIKKIDGVKKMISKLSRRYNESEPVCVIYTGGSIGMIRDKNSDNDSDDLVIASNAREIVSKLPRLRELPTDIHFFSYEKPIDSSNITVNDWLKLSKIIESLYKYYDGFVILHGANTLAYTASALSFIFDNLDKPVIITGSELPLVELGSDAGNNIIGAIRAASPSSKNGPIKVPEVCVLYGNNLLRGNRTTKKYSLNISEGFYSPNTEPIGEYKSSKLSIHNIRKRIHSQNTDLITHRGFDDMGVFILELYPGINFKWFKNIFEENDIKGLVIKSYTTGNVPEDIDFEKLIISLLKRGVIIVNITQCPVGQVELRLFETSAKIFDLGVVNGGDMTLEAAYCKLKYLIGIYGDHIANKDTIKNEFQENLRGEMSLSAYSLVTNSRDLITKGNNIYGTPANRFGGSFDFNDIDNAFIRLQGVRITKNDSNNVPEFELYYNRPGIDSTPIAEDQRYKLASFKKIIDKNNEFNKNIEITHRLRKFYTENEKVMIQVVTPPDISFTVESIKIIVYTKSR